MSVRGLAFQQQDRAVAACATTAIWTALQRVCRHDGARAPTPSAITEAAVRNFIAQGRPFPSPGLTIEQICEALRGFEFAPELFKVGASPKRFRLLLQAYVRSGIPVILGLRGEGEDIGHAVTVVGYREDPAADLSFEVDGTNFDVSNLGFEKIYIHDDRYGPYARARLVEKSTPVKKGKKTTPAPEPDFKMLIDNLNEEWKVEVAVVPLYPKLRTTAAELFASATDLIPLVESEFAGGGERVNIDMHFDRSGSYLASLSGLGWSAPQFPTSYK